MYPYVEGTYLRDIESPELVKPTLNIPSVVSSSGRSSANWWELVEPVTPKYLDPSYFGPRPEEEEEMGEFRKGLNRFVESSQASAYGASAAIGDLLGIDSLRDWGIEGYQRNMEEASKYEAAVPGATSIHSFRDFGDWLAGTSGELLGNVATALATSGGSALLAKTVAGSAVKKYAADTIKDRATEIAAQNAVNGIISNEVKNAATAQATKEVLGNIYSKIGAAAMAGYSSTMESGSNYGEDVMRHGIENTSPGQDILFGLASGISEAILGAESSLWKAVTGKTVSNAVERSFRQELVRGLPKALASEAGQEAFQEILSAVNANIQDAKGLITTEDIKDIIDAAAAGARHTPEYPQAQIFRLAGAGLLDRPLGGALRLGRGGWRVLPCQPGGRQRRLQGDGVSGNRGRLGGAPRCDQRGSADAFPARRRGRQRLYGRIRRPRRCNDA